MAKVLNKARIVDLLKRSTVPAGELKEVHSLDDIPSFDCAEDEARWWRTRTISQDLLDQIPAQLEDEE